MSESTHGTNWWKVAGKVLLAGLSIFAGVLVHRGSNDFYDWCRSGRR